MTPQSVATLSYLQAALANKDTYAVVSQDAVGNLSISIDIGAGVADLALPPLVGPQGPSGQAQFGLRLQPEVLADPSLLPTDLTPTDADIGRYWLIDIVENDEPILSAAFIWFGTEFRVLQFGTQGPPGLYPLISPNVSLIGADQVSQIAPVTGAGSSADPYSLTVDLSVPEGPAGPSATLASMSDVDETTPPTIGQFLAYGGSTWAPTDVGDIAPRPYVIPQAAFSNYAGITFSKTVTVCTFAVPPNPFPWKPLVWGQINMFELELSFSPFLIGIEVRLGDPDTGTLVGRGFGNSLGGVVTIMPHTSSPESPSTQMTPGNDVGWVDANHIGNAGTLYVNVINDGIAAVYDFAPNSAQLFVLACAATTQQQLQTNAATIYGRVGS